MKQLQVSLGDRSYPILVGSNLLSDADILREGVSAAQIMIVSNDVVAPLYLEAVQSAFSERETQTVILADGEQFKNLASFEQIISALLEHGFDRGCTLIALGGGVVGDITGFAAASYQRGVNFVQIPTTLLAQVDSSVGGKTAVNHRLGKNMIGAFHQPIRVIADINTLHTLDARELRAGVAEIIKYGLLGDLEFFEWLEANLEGLLKLDETCVSFAIERSCNNKASIVAQDERESGVRALLNLGHTFGHGIENVYGYGTWLHGEAVACGMVMAAELSLHLGLLEREHFERARALIQRAGLPVAPPADISADALEAAMQVDKKNRDGKIRLILLRSIGMAFITDDYDHAALRAVLAGENHRS